MPDLMDIDTDDTISPPALQVPTSKKGKAKGKIPNPIIIPQDDFHDTPLPPIPTDKSQHHGKNENAFKKDIVDKKAYESVLTTNHAVSGASTKGDKNFITSEGMNISTYDHPEMEALTHAKNDKTMTASSSRVKSIHNNHPSTQGPTNVKGDKIITSLVSSIKSVDGSGPNTGTPKLGLFFRTPTKTESTLTEAALTSPCNVGTPKAPFSPCLNTVIGTSSHIPGTPKIGTFHTPSPRLAEGLIMFSSNTSRVARLLAFDDDYDEDEDEDENLPPPPEQVGVNTDHHDSWSPKSVHTAKCDNCGVHNKSVIQFCNRCGQQFCRVCIVGLPEGHKHYKKDIDALKWDAKDTPTPKPRRRADGAGPTAVSRTGASTATSRRAPAATSRNRGTSSTAKTAKVSGRGDVASGSQSHTRRPSLDDVASGRVRKIVSPNNSAGQYATLRKVDEDTGERFLSEAANRTPYHRHPFGDLSGLEEEDDGEEVFISTPYKGRSYNGEVINVERETEFQRQLRFMKQGKKAPEREKIPDQEKQLNQEKPFLLEEGAVYVVENGQLVKIGYQVFRGGSHETLHSQHANRSTQIPDIHHETGAQWSDNLTPNPFKNIPSPYKSFPPGSSGVQTTTVDNELFRVPSRHGKRSSKERVAMVFQMAASTSTMGSLPDPYAPLIRYQDSRIGFAGHAFAPRTQQYRRAPPISAPNEQPWDSPADSQQQFKAAIAQVMRQKKEKEESIKLREKRDLDNKLYHYKERCSEAWASNDEIQDLLQEGKMEEANEMFAAAKVLVAFRWGVPAELISSDD